MSRIFKVRRIVWICVLCLLLCSIVSCKKREKEHTDNKQQTTQESIEGSNLEDVVDKNGSEEDNSEKTNPEQEEIDLPEVNLHDETSELNGNDISQENSQESDMGSSQDNLTGNSDKETEDNQEEGTDNPPSNEEETGRNPITLPPMKLD